jgi:cohesin complex subunit SA-1/2
MTGVQYFYYFHFTSFIEVFNLQPDEEEKPVRRRGRPRKIRDAPPAKKLFEEPDASSEEEEDHISGSDNEAQYQHDDDDEADQPLIHTIKSAAKLRGMRVPHQRNSKPSSSRKSGMTFKILYFLGN